jgi:CRP-like cAMP-binding protein
MRATATMQRKIAELARGGRRNGKSAPPVEGSREKLGYLLETEVFAPLSPEERTWLAESTAMVTCDPGRVFYTPDETGEVVFILKRGRVNLYRTTPEGRKLIVATLGPHTVFGEMSLIGQAMYGCFAEAAEECLICVLSRSDLQTLIRRNPEVGLRLLAEMANRLQAREAELESLAFHGVTTRLANLLLENADAYGTVTGYSHQDLAERLGIYRETVSQTLGKFRAEGLISVEPKRIRLIDRPGLERHAQAG